MREESKGILIMALINFFYMVFAWGFVAWLTYKWFILAIPALDDLPRFNYLEACAIRLFVATFTMHKQTRLADEYQKEIAQQFLTSMILPPIALVMLIILKIFVFNF
ncbi:MAG TPA: hypothetical protein VGE06_03125 [Flavisolibacter sp.]